MKISISVEIAPTILFTFAAAAFLAGCVSEPVKQEPKQYAVFYKAKAISTSHIELAGGMKIRLIGVEPPAPAFPGKPGHPFREESVRLMKQYLNGADVALETGPRELDRFDVPLAFVFVKEADPSTGKPVMVFLNAMVLERGWGKFTGTGENNKYDDVLYKAQMKAQAEKRGIWKFE
jgi:endonuclease YncB( thermonuclease family)